MTQSIKLRGVRVHNLKNVDVDIPVKKLVVVVGVSGSGKSSLAFDTLYAEGQRRYIEGFSAYARQFLDRLEKPDADSIEQIPPAIALRQHAVNVSSWATLATATEIHDHLRLLFASLGRIICPTCNIEVRRDSPSHAAVCVSRLPAGSRFQVAFPLTINAGTDGQSDEHPQNQSSQNSGHNSDQQSAAPRTVGDLASDLIEDGFTRAIVDGRLRTLQEIVTGDQTATEMLVVVDRLVAGSVADERLMDSLELAFASGQARCELICQEPPDTDGGVDDLFVDTLAIDGRPWHVVRFDASMCCASCGASFTNLEPRLFSFNSPLGSCSDCNGSGTLKLDSSVTKSTDETAAFDNTCPTCDGQRLRREALSVRIGADSIADVCQKSVEQAIEFLTSLGMGATGPGNARTRSLMGELNARLGYLQAVGVGYLTLDRRMNTLSGGEAQRVALTVALGSNLVNTLYVLDEPSTGLHPSDSERVIDSIRRLRDAGNSVVLVEHDEAFIRAADHVIEIGPGAGGSGGELIFEGAVDDLMTEVDSPTAKFLSGRDSVRRDSVRLTASDEATPSITLRGARHHNLKDINVEIPLGSLCVVTGVSGSGKSSLVDETLYPAVCQELKQPIGDIPRGAFSSIHGVSQIDQVVLVDQQPIGRSPRSNPVTYLKAFDDIRKLFAQTVEAKLRNFTASNFSFNTKGGRCPKCEGHGTITIDMQFLADLSMTCPECNGTRFLREILEAKYRGRTIDEVLRMTVRDAFAHFRNQARIQKRLNTLREVGLDYVPLGQSAKTLSGGESQRLKLASFLASGTRSRILFLLDEPTRGLHAADVARVIRCFDSLLAFGHSLVVVEHNLDVIRAADHVIDLGPGAGEAGGTVLTCGPPSEVAESNSPTGRWLRDVLKHQ